MFTVQPNKLSSEFVVNYILAEQDENRLEKTMRQVISEALKGVALSDWNPSGTGTEIQTTNGVSNQADTPLDEI